MTTLFYMLGADALCHADPALPDGTRVRIWRPATDGLPPAGRRSLRNLLWWAFSRLGLFASPDFVEVTLWEHGRVQHQLIVTPRWWRFPFMAADDLQLGDLWTHPDARGRGLARAAVAIAHRIFRGQARRFWYLVQADNEPSIALIEGCGYTLVARGRRTSPLGIRPAGRFLLEGPTA